MIRDPSGHRRCGPATGMGQTRMRCAKIIDRTDQIHPMLQRQRAARQRPTAACQRGQTLTKRRVQPLDVRRVDHAVALRATPERLNACGRAIHDAALDVDDAPLGVALHDLGDADVAPGAQPGTPVGSRPDRIAKGLANRADIGAQAIGTEQQRAMEGTGAHPLDQPPDQRHVALLADLASQPQAGADHHGQRHPHDAPLALDADLVGLHLAQVTRLLDQMLLDGLALAASACPPRRHRPLVEPKGHHDGLQRTAMGEQRDDERHRLGRGAQAVEDRACRGGEGLAALRADEALVLARMDANIALAGLASGGTRQIGAECRCGVHDCPPWRWGTCQEEYVWTPVCYYKRHLTTV